MTAGAQNIRKSKYDYNKRSLPVKITGNILCFVHILTFYINGFSFITGDDRIFKHLQLKSIHCNIWKPIFIAWSRNSISGVIKPFNETDQFAFYVTVFGFVIDINRNANGFRGHY